MSDALSDLGDEAARLLEQATGLPIVVSDRRGKAVAGTAPAAEACPLFAREEDRARPLPSRCEECARIATFAATDLEDVAPCPHGADAVLPLRTGPDEPPKGFLATAVLPKDRAGALARAEPTLKLVQALFSAALAAEERERTGRNLLAQKLLVARTRIDRALERCQAATGPGAAAAKPELLAVREAIEAACTIIEAMRKGTRLGAEVAAAVGRK